MFKDKKKIFILGSGLSILLYVLLTIIIIVKNIFPVMIIFMMAYIVYYLRKEITYFSYNFLYGYQYHKKLVYLIYENINEKEEIPESVLLNLINKKLYDFFEVSDHGTIDVSTNFKVDYRNKTYRLSINKDNLINSFKFLLDKYDINQSELIHYLLDKKLFEEKFQRAIFPLVMFNLLTIVLILLV